MLKKFRMMLTGAITAVVVISGSNVAVSYTHLRAHET